MTIQNLQRYLETSVPGACVPVDLVKISENVSGHRGYVHPVEPRAWRGVRGSRVSKRTTGLRRGLNTSPLVSSRGHLPGPARGFPQSRRNGKFGGGVRGPLRFRNSGRGRGYNDDYEPEQQFSGYPPDDPYFHNNLNYNYMHYYPEQYFGEQHHLDYHSQGYSDYSYRGR